jgi:Cysteine-rich secretory protein family
MVLKWKNQGIVQFALSLINRDRATQSLSPVTLSPISSAQEHASSMLRFRYFSHWNVNGLKPYARYGAAGGRGAVSENIAYFTSSWRMFVSMNSVRRALKKMEWGMMHDDAASDNLHRDNILNPLHNRVSIGVAFDRRSVYFVQDFEDSYVQIAEPFVPRDNEIMISGSTSLEIKRPQITIHFDGWPAQIGLSELRHDPRYGGSYALGDMIGGVFSESEKGRFYHDLVNVYSSQWSISGRRVFLRFSLVPFVKEKGRGLYTVCMSAEEQGKVLELLMVSIPVDCRSCPGCGRTAGLKARFCSSCGNEIVHDELVRNFRNLE